MLQPIELASVVEANVTYIPSFVVTESADNLTCIVESYKAVEFLGGVLVPGEKQTSDLLNASA